MNERQLPHNLEIEKVILSSCMHDAFNIVSDNQIDENTFYSHINREIFKAIKEIKKDGLEPDLLVLANKLLLNGKLEYVGGEVFLAGLYTSIATTANINSWIEQHLEYHAKRLMINKCNETLSKCYIGESDAKTIFNEHRSELKDVESFSCGKTQIPTIEKLGGFINYVQEMQVGESGYIVPFGINGIDNLVQLQLKQIFTLGGLSNTGKTRFILCDAIGKMQKGISSAIFSWENPSNIIISGMVSIISGVAFSDMTKPKGITPAQMQRISSAMKFLKDNSHLLYIFGKGDYIHSTSGISAETRRIQDNTGGELKTIYIDHLQNMKSNIKEKVEQIQSNVYGIGDICSDFNVAAFLLTQLNRDKDRDKSGRRPILADTKGSGAIEDGSDYVAFLHRTDKSVGTVELDFYSEKVRGSQRFDEKILFNTLTGEMRGLVSRYGEEDRKF